MDSCQSKTKRSFDVMELQNQDNNMASTSEETVDCAKETKQLKQELDPLKIPNVLEKVFFYLDADSIKNARQVNPLWSVEGAKSLITKCFVKIPWPCRMQHLDSSEMNEFKAFLSLKSCHRSMIPNIMIATLGDFDLWKSLEVLGPQVKAVKLKNVDDDAKLLQKLLDRLPNLKHLNIRDSLFNDTIIPVLTSVMSREEKIGSKRVISNVIFNAKTFVKLAEFEDFTNCNNIMIEELKLVFNPKFFNNAPDFKVRVVNIINKLLSTNQNILKLLDLHNCQLLLSLVEFPSMPALTHINFDFCPLNLGKLRLCKFPSSFRFSEKVPNLQEFCVNDKPTTYFITLQGRLEDVPASVHGFFQHLLENTGPAPSVKRVKYLYDHERFDGEFLFKMFPNVEDLQISLNPDYQRVFRSLWTLGTNLRKLRLTFNKVAYDANLDSIFTGFTSKTVDKIKHDPNLAPYSLKKLEKFRVNPSILNLKELEQITIDLVYSATGWEDITMNLNRSNRKRNMYQPKRMLTVAEKYSFRLLPKNPGVTVNVEQGYNGRWRVDGAMEALEEVSGLANVSVKKIKANY